jgi:hypothetical protein
VRATASGRKRRQRQERFGNSGRADWRDAGWAGGIYFLKEHAMSFPEPNPSLRAEPSVPALSYPLTPEALTPVPRMRANADDRASPERPAHADDPGGQEYASWMQRLGGHAA